MNEGHVSQAARSAGDAAQGGALTRPRPPEGGQGGPTAEPPRPPVAAHPPGWTGGRITALVVGALLVLISLGFLGAGGTALWADRTQRDGGYITTDLHEFSTAGSALVTVPTHLGSGGTGWLYAPGLLDQVRIRATPVSPGSSLFVGIGPSAEVDRYLAGVNHTVITEFWGDRVQNAGGGAPGSPPATQDFWVASATGTGPQTLEWNPGNGSWSVVVMNADGRPGVAMTADLGARIPALPWIAVGVLVAGVVFAAGGVLLVAGAIRGAAAG